MSLHYKIIYSIVNYTHHQHATRRIEILFFRHPLRDYTGSELNITAGTSLVPAHTFSIYCLLLLWYLSCVSRSFGLCIQRWTIECALATILLEVADWAYLPYRDRCAINKGVLIFAIYMQTESWFVFQKDDSTQNSRLSDLAHILIQFLSH